MANCQCFHIFDTECSCEKNAAASVVIGTGAPRVFCGPCARTLAENNTMASVNFFGTRVVAIS